MRLTELRIDRLPGIDSPFALEAARLGEGLHVIVGPNESGKSSICRAVRQLLWEEAPGEERSSSVRVRGRWSGGGHDWTAEREGSGSPRWQRDGIESPAPPLPDVHLARCYTLGIRDLLSDDTDSTDERLAARIRQELAGGYDLERVLRERFDVGKAIGRKEKGALKERRAELEARIRKQKEIAERQNSLGNLKGERDDARRAQVRLKTLELALDLAVERAALVAATRLLEELPPGMERLGGNEGEILRQLDADIDENDGEQRDQQALLEESSGGPAGSAGGVTDPPPSEATLGVWLERAVQLEGAERSRDAARKAAAAARARLADARATLARGIDPEGAQDVTPEAVDRAASILRRAERNAVRREALERWRGQLPELSPEEDERADPLRRGVEALEDWHAAPAPAPAAREVRRLLWLTASLALLLAILGVFLGSVTHPAGWGLLLPAAAALLLAARIGGESKRPMGEGAERAREARRRFDESGLAPPPEWSRPAVAARIAELRAELAAALLRAEGEGERRRVAAEIVGLDEEEQQLERERQTLREEAGVDPRPGDRDLLEFLQGVHAWQAARMEAAGADAVLEEEKAQVAAALEALNEFIISQGGEAPADAAAATAAIENLRQRARALVALAKLEEKRRTLLERRERLFRDADLEPGDREGLRERLGRRESFRAAQKEHDRHRCRVEKLAESLRTHDDLLHLGEEDARALIRDEELRAEKLAELAEQIGSIGKEIDAAEGARAMEDALAAVDEAHDALLARREEALHAAAGRFLIERARERLRREHQPRVLGRARRLFAAFTHHRYELRVGEAAEGAPSFIARDTRTGRGLTLAQLSDGTRSQLLLAARLAFTEEAEHGEPLPIFLDEALSHSDPKRFEAVAESLLTLAGEEQRQIFVLTCDPKEVEHWRRVRAARGEPELPVIDLGEIRALARAGAEAADYRLPLAPEIPSPDGLSAGQYARRLRVPQFDPLEPLGAHHLFHLLREDLPLLRRLLEAGIDSIGAWRSLRGEGGAEAVVGEEAAARLDCSIATLEAFIDAWSVGRGKPVDRVALVDGGVSKAFIDDVSELTRQLRGDARALVAALEDHTHKLAKGFYRRALEKLRSHLIEHGYLDERDPLEKDAVNARVLADLGRAGHGNGQPPQETARRVHELWVLAGGNEGRGRG